MDMFGLAALAAGAAVAIAVWVYGIYCYVQMVRHRRPGVSRFELVWSPDRLTPVGLEYRRRALRSYAALGILAIVVMLLGSLLAAAWGAGAP
jgi:hypothetical protein